ncbi:hypothetical protein HK405_008925 [Cladochytrium tenue]|nr:hypothetical protein HK405_008925 [Cladochytrium tenue]
MREGRNVPKEVVLLMLRDAVLRRQQDVAAGVCPGYLIDGFPRARDQALAFERAVGPARAVLFFHCPLDTLEARLLDRGKSSGRADDNLDSIRKRFRTFEEESLPVLDLFEAAGTPTVIKVSSVSAVDDVYADVEKRLMDAGIVAAEPALPVAPPALPFDRSKIVFVLGGPGSGKGTQCDRIVENLHYSHLSTGDLLRDEVKKGSELGKELEDIMKEGKMVPLDVTLRLLVSAMEQQRGKAPGYLIDGFPRTMDQAAEFERCIGRCSFVLFFDAPNDVLTTRLLKRGETSGRADDNLESIRKRLETFAEASLPVVTHFERDGRVRRIRADGDVASITEATLKCFE